MLATMVSLGSWNWFILAVILFVIELIAPGAFMLWLGIAAVLVGLISIGIERAWQAQIITFALLSVAAIPIWRRFAHRVEQPVDRPFLNQRAQGYLGRVFTLEKPIVDGVGTIRIDDTVWRVNGPDCPAGSRVRIAHVDGANLSVEPAS